MITKLLCNICYLQKTEHNAVIEWNREMPCKSLLWLQKSVRSKKPFNFGYRSAWLVFNFIFWTLGCQNYTSLTDADRKTSFVTQSRKSDSGLVPGWFRFEGEAGTKMPTSCPDPYRCNTEYAGWLKGDHPKKINQSTSERVCFRNPRWRQKCCPWYINIKVINCGSYYVYYLKNVPTFWIYGRYCSDD